MKTTALRSMKSGETIDLGNGVTITKLVIRSSVAERSSSTGTKLGRRHFSRTSYHVKRNGRYLDIVGSPDAALALAKREGSRP